MVSLVVAIDDQNGIGKNGTIPWNYPEDLTFFRRITSHMPDETRHPVVIMGRKTKESLPCFPLPGRENVVVSKDGPDVREVIDTYRQREDVGRITVMGGGEIYKICIEENLCDYIYVTHIPGTHGCDTFFPKIEEERKIGTWPLGRLTRSLFCAASSSGACSSVPACPRQSEGQSQHALPSSTGDQ